MSTAKPTTIILVHGAWHTPECFDLCRAPLEAAGYTVIARQSPSASNDPSTIAHTVEDDTAQLRDDIRAAAALGRDVVLVGHSYGGFLITAAAKGLVKGEDGLPGGVVQLVYICSLVPEAGPEPWALVPEILNPPWIKPVDGHPELLDASADAPQTFYNDLAAADAERWTAKLLYQSALVFQAVVEWAAWRHIPTAYLICERDNALIPAVQERMTARAGDLWTVERCGAGHSPFLSMPGFTADFIMRAAERGWSAAR